jgi:hypothetical protein
MSVTWHSLWVATQIATDEIITSVATLLPAPIAAAIYGAVLSQQKPIDPPNPTRRAARIVIHVAVALFVVLVIHTVGGGCPQDEAGYCDDDWKPPTPVQSLANFLRVSFLTLGGMAWAAYWWKRDK